MKQFAVLLVLLVVPVVLAACGGGGGGTTPAFQIPQIPAVVSSTRATDETGTAPTVPMAEVPTDAFFLQLLTHCATRAAPQEASWHTATRTIDHREVITWSIELYRRAIANDERLVGRDLPAKLLRAGEAPDLSGNSINVIEAKTAPNVPGDFGAYALPNTVLMMDDLMNAMCESAAYWDRLIQATNTGSGEDENLVDATDLVLGIGKIFSDNAKGNFGVTVPDLEIADRINNRTFAFEAYWGSVAYVLFHELGHANLSHGLFKCMVTTGIDQILTEAGVTPTPAEITALKLEVAKISRATETQSDIYAATIAERSGFSSNGPGIMVIGFLAIKLIDGTCDALSDPELTVCLFDQEGTSTHPPLDLRAEIAVSVIDDKVDLTPLLDIVEILGER